MFYYYVAMGEDEPTTERPVPSLVDALTSPDDAAWALAGCRPGVESVAVTAALPCGRLSAAGRVDALVALQRQIGFLQARQVRLLAGMADADPSDDAWGREEVACALRLAPATVPARLHEASALCRRLPRTLAAVERGELTLRHATVLAGAVEQLGDEIAAAVENRVLTRGAAQTVPEFRRSVRRAVLDLDSRSSADKHRDAVADRRVIFTPVEDGMTELWALLPADGAALLQAALNRCAYRDARTVRTAGAAAGERAEAMTGPPISAARTPSSTLPVTTTPAMTPAGTATAGSGPVTTPAISAARTWPAPTCIPAAPATRPGRRCRSWWRCPPCSAPTTNPASSPATDRYPPPWPDTSPRTRPVPGGGSSPTP